ncbi:hypothetical protein RF11_10103 [Thelohanellus kitauei]|uniref:Uncharacterized protein n=1 Tax=Thelohanellus kitauei TaxID=669202 RepID=A0A0C2IYA1_THEKT|nr:hypothetical protein RF11_10103 [Thelohanellus kitauei]
MEDHNKVLYVYLGWKLCLKPLLPHDQGKYHKISFLGGSVNPHVSPVLFIVNLKFASYGHLSKRLSVLILSDGQITQKPLFIQVRDKCDYPYSNRLVSSFLSARHLPGYQEIYEPELRLIEYKGDDELFCQQARSQTKECEMMSTSLLDCIITEFLQKTGDFINKRPHVSYRTPLQQ